jgi:hypothetical protein
MTNSGQKKKHLRNNGNFKRGFGNQAYIDSSFNQFLNKMLSLKEIGQRNDSNPKILKGI